MVVEELTERTRLKYLYTVKCCKGNESISPIALCKCRRTYLLKSTMSCCIQAKAKEPFAGLNMLKSDNSEACRHIKTFGFSSSKHVTVLGWVTNSNFT